jgi:methylated-DNA-[protein]-cysteine S-methyltransferase
VKQGAGIGEGIIPTAIDSPVGGLLLWSNGESLRQIDFLAEGDSVTFSTPGRENGAFLDDVIHQLNAYFAGDLQSFDLPLAPRGTPFQLGVWKRLCEIPYGETITYGELAALMGNPKAARAVGLANGSNPIPIIIPCHRVIGSSGKLVGYGGGLPRKEKLLSLERRQLRLL